MGLGCFFVLAIQFPFRTPSYFYSRFHKLFMKGEPELELNDLLRIAGIGLVIGFLHVFFEQTGKKEFSFFLFFVAYIYIAAEMLRFLRIFFSEIAEFFQWLSLAF